MQGNPPQGVHVHCGNLAWERARTFIEGGAVSVAHIVFPKDAEPDAFRWHCSAGLVVSILHNSDGRDSVYPPVLEPLAEGIVKAGARRVFLIDPKWPVRVYAPRSVAA